MVDLREIAAYQSEVARDRYLTRQIQRQQEQDEAPKAAVYQGYDAALGLHSVQTLGNEVVVTARALTNAGIEPGEAIIVEGSRYDAKPRTKRSLPALPVFAGEESLTTLLLTAARFDRPTLGQPVQVVCQLWLQQFGAELKSYRVPLGDFLLSSSNAYDYFFGSLALFERDRQIVQIEMGGTLVLLPTQGAPEIVFFPQPVALEPNGYYERNPSALERQFCDLFTLYIEGEEIQRIEGTLKNAVVEQDYLQYSDYFDSYLPYLQRTAENLYRDETNPTIASWSLEGRAEFREPEEAEFKALRNVFGAEPAEYFLGEGDRATFPLTLEDLELGYFNGFLFQGDLRFDEYINAPNTQGIYPSLVHLFQGEETGVFSEVFLEFSSVRGLLQ